jgi:hypothetical protein
VVATVHTPARAARRSGHHYSPGSYLTGGYSPICTCKRECREAFVRTAIFGINWTVSDLAVIRTGQRDHTLIYVLFTQIARCATVQTRCGQSCGEEN